mgnify:CR=1 FL=1
MDDNVKLEKQLFSVTKLDGDNLIYYYTAYELIKNIGISIEDVKIMCKIGKEILWKASDGIGYKIKRMN